MLCLTMMHPGMWFECAFADGVDAYVCMPACVHV